MKWFKHETHAMHDEKIQLLIDKFGDAGYLMYFGCLELCAEKIDEKMCAEVEISWSHLQRFLRKRRAVVEQFLNSCSTSNLLLATLEEDKVKISIPNLLSRIDNHTRNLQATCKRLNSKNKNKNKNKSKKKNKDKDVGGDFITVLQNNRAYCQLDVAAEAERARLWITTNAPSRRFTKAYLVAWLNRSASRLVDSEVPHAARPKPFTESLRHPPADRRGEPRRSAQDRPNHRTADDATPAAVSPEPATHPGGV